MSKVVTYEKSIIQKVFDFIEESLYLIQIKRNIKYEDIIILVPFEYKFLFEKYVRENLFYQTHSSEIIKFRGVNIQYTSPEKACYIYLKDFIYYDENKEGIWFKLDLITTK